MLAMNASYQNVSLQNENICHENVSLQNVKTQDISIPDMIHKVKIFNQKEKTHILNILKSSGMSFTKNNNGYFFNLTNIESETLETVNKCVELIEHNRGLIRKRDQKRDETMQVYKRIIDDRVAQTILQKQMENIHKLTIKDCHVNILMTISKPTKSSEYIDPDELIKRAMQKQKYHKSSVHFRINSVLKSIRSSNKKLSNKSEHVDNSDNFQSKDDVEDLGDDVVDDIDDIGDVGDDVVDDIDIGDVVVDDVDDVVVDEIGDDQSKDTENDEDNEDDEDDIEVESDEVNDIINSDEVESADHDHDDETETATKSEEKTETDISFYRKLLNKQGFVFDDDSKCRLVYQEYIK